jgi:hypothetical protein
MSTVDFLPECERGFDQMDMNLQKFSNSNPRRGLKKCSSHVVDIRDGAEIFNLCATSIDLAHKLGISAPSLIFRRGENVTHRGTLNRSSNQPASHAFST